MPDIPQFRVDPSIPVVTDTARADPNALAQPGLEAVRQGNQLQTAGTRLESVGDALGKLQEFHNTTYYNDHLADATTSAHERLQNGIEEARQTGDYQGFARQQLDALHQDIQPRLENAPGGLVSSRLERRFAVLQDQIRSRASTFEHGMAQQTAIANIGDQADRAGVNVYRDPSMAFDEYGRVGSAIDEFKRQGLLNPEQYQKLKRSAGNAIFGAAVRARADSDPQGLAADWKAGAYDDFLDPAHIERLAPVVSNAKAKSVGDQVASKMLAGGGAAATGGGDNWETQHNNFGGLRIPGSTVGPKAGGFQSFDTPEAGVAAISHQLDRYASGATTGQPLDTLRKIISTWAPASENDTAGLIARATKITGFSPDQQLDLSDPATKAKLIEATIRNEQGGRLPVDPGVIAKVAGAAPPAKAADVTSPGAPDLGSGLADVQKRIDANELTPEEGAKAAAVVTGQYHRRMQATAQERAALENDTRNGIAMLASGRDWTPDPAAIRRLLPAEKAAETLRAIDEAREQGNARQMVQWASPEDLAQLAQRTQDKLAGGQDFARQQRFADTLSKAIVARNKELDTDPAGFVSEAPAVAAARQAAQAAPQDAGKAQAAIQASLAEQARLGVPTEGQRVLSKPEAGAMARQITSADPAKTDMGAALDQTAQRFGAYWPQAFGDLVKSGLPGEAQLLAAMDTPDQAAARTDFQRMISTLAEKGGPEQLKKAAPHEAVQAIGQGIDERMAPFRATVRDPKLYDAVKSGVEHLAYFYAFQGQGAEEALRNAYAGVIARKYDFDGSIRAPKGLLAPTETLAAQAVNGLKAADLPDIEGNAELTPDQRRAVYLSAIRNGEWRTNADETGIVRMARFRDGTMIPATRADGSRITVRFSDAAKAPPAPPPDASSGSPF